MEEMRVHGRTPETESRESRGTTLCLRAVNSRAGRVVTCFRPKSPTLMFASRKRLYITMDHLMGSSLAFPKSIHVVLLLQ